MYSFPSPRPQPFGKTRLGMTIIELLVTLVVIGLLLLGLSRLTSTRGESALVREAADQFLSAYQAGRAEAVTSGQQVIIYTDSPASGGPPGTAPQWIIAISGKNTTPPFSSLPMGRISLTDGVVFGSGTATTPPILGATLGAAAPTLVRCTQLCIFGAPTLSFDTFYFSHEDDPSTVAAVIVSQSGQAIILHWNPTTSTWS